MHNNVIRNIAPYDLIVLEIILLYDDRELENAVLVIEVVL